MIPAPASYGKLPAYGDFYQHRAAGQAPDAWWSWFARSMEHCDFSPSAAPPWCFALPPGFMTWSGRNCVIGVLAGSRDRVGRDFPLVIWQSAPPARVLRFLTEAGTGPERDWLFWLSRLAGAVCGHMQDVPPLIPGKSDFGARLEALWELFRPRWRELVGIGRRRAPSRDALEMLAGGPRQETRHGVRHMPWADWPARLAAPGAWACFWAMDGRGRYLEAVTGKKPDTELLARLFARNGKNL